MKSFYSHMLDEASVMKPDYVAGHEFIYKGKGVKELQGYNNGDVFTIVAPDNKAIEVSSRGGDIVKYLKAPDGKVFKFVGGAGSYQSYFTHNKAAGKPPSGAEWEDLIVYAFNEMNGQSTDSETKEVAMKFWDFYEEQANEVAKKFKAKIKSKRLVQTGRGMGKISLGPFWTEAGAGNKTPKTDIAGADYKEKFSLKKEGGSQLISAGKEESIAIVNAALSDLGEDAKFAQELMDAMEAGMSKLISKETVTALKQQSKSGSKSKEVLDFQEKDRQNKELSDMLAQHINGNRQFAQYLVFEASTGNHKFGSPSSKAAANKLAKFDPGSGKVEVEDISSVDSKLIKQYASKAKPYVAFKKGGSNSPAYSAFRLGLNSSYEPTFSDILIEELSADFSHLLTEDLLQEGPMDWVRKIGTAAKNMGSSAVAKLKSALQKAWRRVKAAFVKIKKMGKRMFSALMNFFGIQIASARGIPGEVNL